MGLFGMDSYTVQVEADLSQGLPRFDIVGLPDAAISEAKNRVRSAIKNTGFAFPVSRITVNLAPADTRKEGSVYDLPILMALLKAGRQIDFDSDNTAFIGEVALDGIAEPRGNVVHVGAEILVAEDALTQLAVAVDDGVYEPLVFAEHIVPDIVLQLKMLRLCDRMTVVVTGGVEVPDAHFVFAAHIPVDIGGKPARIIVAGKLVEDKVVHERAHVRLLPPCIGLGIIVIGVE